MGNDTWKEEGGERENRGLQGTPKGTSVSGLGLNSQVRQVI